MANIRKLWATRVVALVLGLVLFADSNSALGDRITLRGGGQIEGKVLPDPNHPDRVVVLTAKGKTPLSFQKPQIIRVAAESSALDEYLLRRVKAPLTAEGQHELGVWCDEHKLPDLAEIHYEAAVKQDKTFAPAHQKLGHALVGDRWLTGDEIRESQGLVKYKGKWVLAEERDRREAAAAAGAEQVTWARRIRLLRQTMLGGPDERRRREAEDQLDAIRDPIAVGPLVRVLGDDITEMRTKLDHVLGSIPGPEAASALVSRMLYEHDPDVRHATLAELEQRTEPNVVPTLVRALRSQTPEIVNRAAWTLARLNVVSAVPQLVPALISIQYRVVMDPDGNATAGGYISTPPTPSMASAPIAYNGSSIGLLTPPAVAPGAIAYGGSSVSLPYSPYSNGAVTYGSGSSARGPVPKLLAYTYQNVEVLQALIQLTGRDFGFDIPAWKHWVATSFRADPAPARRVPQP